MRSYFLLLFSFVFLVSCGRSATAENSEEEKRPLFFIVHSKQSEWHPSLTEAKRGKLVLIDVDSSVLYFTSEQTRSAGKMDMDQFISLFEDGTEDDLGYPIHAALVHFDTESKQGLDVDFLLTDPTYDEGAQTLTFKGELIGAPLEETKMLNTNIYIDDSSRYALSKDQ